MSSLLPLWFMIGLVIMRNLVPVGLILNLSMLRIPNLPLVKIILKLPRFLQRGLLGFSNLPPVGKINLGFLVPHLTLVEVVL